MEDAWNIGWILFLFFFKISTQDACPPGFVLYGRNQNCYSIVAQQTTWASALEYCSIIDGSLAQITDADLQAYLADQIKRQNNDTEYTISTGNDYLYHYIVANGVDVRGQTSISFQVMACNDVHIALSKDKGVDRQNTYEIVIGGWADSMSVIRDCKQCAHMDTERHQVHPVDCNKYLPFWISWTNNVIKVGKGIDVGKQTFLTWNDTAPHAVNYVAFATGWGATGKWKVTRGTFNPGQFWIGGSDLANENNWLWLPSKQAFNYKNWAPNEPDNSNFYEHCALMDIHRGYKWADDNCEENRNFICETSVADQTDGEIIGK